MRRAAVVALALPLAAGCGGAERGRDVVLLSLDSVRADVLTFEDAEVAPRLTALAEGGTVFTRAISGSSWTLPTHAQMFTGQPPLLHGVQYDDIAIDPKTPTLPRLLSDAGWFTAGFWTGWYLAGEYGFERGFAVYENAMTGGAELEREYEKALARGDLERARKVLGGRDVLSHQDVTSRNVLERVRATVTRVPADTPLFLFGHFFDPHYDYVPPPPFDTRFDPDYDGPFDGRDFYRDPRIFDGRRRIGDRDLEHIVQLYRGEVAWTDSVVGELLDLLDDLGRLENALVIVVSDHGDEFFEHGGRGHRHTLFDELVHVPLLVRLPGPSAAPRRSTALVSLSDLAPTVLDALGLEVPGSVDGRSLLPVLRGEPLVSRPVPLSLTLTGPDGARVTRVLDGLRGEDFKLVRLLEVDEDSPRPRVVEELWFDLASDPAEQKPVRRATNPELRAAAELLDAELERLAARHAEAERSPASRRTTRIREVFAADLADLGYADDEGGAGSPSFALPWGVGPHPPPARGE